MATQDPLAPYRAKRYFRRTAEPPGTASKRRAARAGAPRFVVQKHDASRLHYDLRLELGGVLKSWAVARGPSLDPADKRLAVEVEDHPLDYAGFEGVIAGGYGAGTVMVWDAGTWEPAPETGDAAEALARGNLKFALRGERLRGGWDLVRMKPRPKERQPQWLLLKRRDGEAAPGNGDALLRGGGHLRPVRPHHGRRRGRGTAGGAACGNRRCRRRSEGAPPGRGAAGRLRPADALRAGGPGAGRAGMGPRSQAGRLPRGGRRRRRPRAALHPQRPRLDAPLHRNGGGARPEAARPLSGEASGKAAIGRLATAGDSPTQSGHSTWACASVEVVGSRYRAAASGTARRLQQR